MSFYDPDHFGPQHEETDEVDTCPVCYGDGETSEEVCVGTDWVLQTRRCATCKGEGHVPADLDFAHGWMACGYCDGVGRGCSYCGGEGYVYG